MSDESDGFVGTGVFRARIGISGGFDDTRGWAVQTLGVNVGGNRDSGDTGILAVDFEL